MRARKTRDLVCYLFIAFLSACGKPVAPARAPAAELPHISRSSIRVTTNDVILVESESGNAVLQFLEFSEMKRSETNRESSAMYRMRYANDESQVKTVTNTLRESYTARAEAGKVDSYFLTKNPDHNTDIRIGTSKLEWSYASSTAGWLGFYTNQTSLKVLPGASFEDPAK